jgi:hypothetical protein
MEEQSREIKWILANLLVNKIQYPAKKYGNYIVTKFSDYGNILIDKRNLKALVSALDKPYFITEDFEKWLKRGFIVIAFLRKKPVDGFYEQAKYSYKKRYYILDVKNSSIVFVGNDIVESDAFLEGKSDYLILRNTQKQVAIFDKNFHQVSDWYEDIYSYGLVRGKSDYYIARKDGKEALFHKSGKQITDWYKHVGRSGIVYGESDYCIIENGTRKAIFDKDGNQLSNWCDEIDGYDFIEGKSNYYAIKENGKYAVFNQNMERVSDWFEYIYLGITVEKNPDYYKARKDNKEAIFDMNGHRISDWYDYIYPEGLVDGESDYYIAVKNGKDAIFDRSGKQISNWFNWISIDGLVKGRSDYYIVEEDNKQIYNKKRRNIRTKYVCKVGSSKLLGPFADILLWGFIYDPSSTSITVHTLDGKTLDISKTEVDQFFEGEDMNYERER